MAEEEPQAIKQEHNVNETEIKLEEIQEVNKTVEEVEIKIEKTVEDAIIKEEEGLAETQVKEIKQEENQNVDAQEELKEGDTIVKQEPLDTIVEEIQVEEIKQEDQNIEEVQIKIEEGDRTIKEEQINVKDENLEQIPEDDQNPKKEEEINQENKTEEEDKISEIEQVQKIMDFDQVPSLLENVTDLDPGSLQLIKFLEEWEEGVEEEYCNLDDLYPFGPDGLLTPPPTPEESESEVYTDSKKSDDGNKVKIVKSPKGKQTKRAGFKMGSVNDNLSDTGSDYGSVKVVTGIKDREEQKQQAECNRFAGYEKFASHFVDKIIDKSINSVVDNKMYTTQFGAEDQSTLSSYQTFVEIFGTFTKWPRIQEFSIVIGENAINEFMQTWEYNEEWMYCIDFLLEQSDECSEFYLYEVKWSIPSKPYPIPQATASVYFTMEASRVKPPFCPVDVTYVFEGSRTVHSPGKIPFQEDILFSIIDAKLEMYKRLKF